MKLPPEVKTNNDFVHYIMNFSKSGPLSQAFVIEAIRFYSTIIIQNGEPKDDPLSFFSPLAWYNTAKEIHSYWEERYDSKLDSSNLPQ